MNEDKAEKDREQQITPEDPQATIREQLIDELVTNYIAAPHSCPFCKSSNITGDSLDVDDGGALQEVHCEICGKRWTDNYSITSVAFEGEDIDELLRKGEP